VFCRFFPQTANLIPRGSMTTVPHRWLRRPWSHLLLLTALQLASACGRDDGWLARVWGPVRDALPGGGTALALPAEWTVSQAPVTPELLPDPPPIGQWQPFVHKKTQQAWKHWQEGRFAEAAKLAEVAASDPPNDRKELALQAFFLTTTRRYLALTDTAAPKSWQQKARDSLRAATAHPALGGIAVRELAAEADNLGLSPVVLTLLAGREGVPERWLRARAWRRNGDHAVALGQLQSVPVPETTALGRQVALERYRIVSAQGDAAAATALLQGVIVAGKSAEAEEAVTLVLGSDDRVWKQRLQERPAEASLVLDALVFSAQRRRYARVVPALQALADLPQVALAVRCHARSWLVHALDRQAKFDETLLALAKIEPACNSAAVRQLRVDEDPLPDGDLDFRRGRALAILGRPEAKEALQAAIKAKLPGLDGEDAQTLLQTLQVQGGAKLIAEHGVVAAKDYAEKDIVDVVVWRVAQAFVHEGRWPDALKLLDRLAEVRDRSPLPAAGQAVGEDFRWDDRDWGRGRADYFAGRALLAMDQRDKAIARWQRAVQRHPLSYYATMSWAQLQEVGAADPDLLAPVDEVAGPVLDAALLGDQAVARARLLGLLGWHTAAGQELDALGIGRDAGPQGRFALGDPGRVWTRAALDDEAGRWTASHAIGRDESKRYWLRMPGPGNKMAWQLAYPRGFASLMNAAAKEAGIDPAIVYAICRSESGFNARVESHAAAIGLLQLILPTAEAMAKPLGLTATPQTLREPAVNTRLGARYLGKLFERFEREAQMAAGYNAGGGAVGRWRKQRGTWPLDLFVETIPFRETRDYAKRVQSAIAVYQHLYAGKAMPLFALDQKALPAAEEPATEPGKPAANPPPKPQPAPASGKPTKPDPAAKPATAAKPRPPAAKPTVGKPRPKPAPTKPIRKR
jgi:tetratricopeptide (TPR) repeat protein